jgi:catechol 2,3-dioxygenase-like lactoylglutathione lyase family enzyme
MVLQQFERRLERLVEGTFAIAFGKGLQPLEIGRRVAREMDLGRTMGVRGLVAPNAFTVTLSAPDMARFESFAEVLASELAQAGREHAREEGYGLLGPIEVTLTVDPNLRAGIFSVTSEVREMPGGYPVANLVLEGGQRLQIGEDPVIIGRLESCTVVVEDASVSRQHAELRRVEDAIVLVDLNSTNGTRVNGMRVSTHELADGDQIEVGTARFVFESR